MYISENVGKGKEHTRKNAKCRGSPICHWETVPCLGAQPPNSPDSQLPTPDPFLLDQPVSLVFWAPYMASVVSMCLNTHLFIQIWPEGVCGNRRKHQHQQSRAVGVAAGRTIKASCECFNLTGCRMWNILLLCTHFIC